MKIKIIKVLEGFKGNKGDKGGIRSIVKTATVGLVDTYTITFTDGTTTTFNITNGKDGDVTKEQLDNALSSLVLFNPNKEGGYQLGAILDYVDNNGYIFKIKSLVANNTNAPSSTNIKTPTSDSIGTYYWVKVVDGRLFPYSIEFMPLSDQEHNGGVIDFHFNRTQGYTSRIIEIENGLLNIEAPYQLRINNKVLDSFVSDGIIGFSHWRRSYNDGWVEEGGLVQGLANYNDLTKNVTFYSPMIDTYYTALATPAENSGYAVNSATIRYRDETGLSVHTAYQNEETPIFASWYVCGKKA